MARNQATDRKEDEDGLKRAIMSKIQNEGFPLEIRVVNSCYERKMDVDPNIRYEIQEKPREIDVYSRFIDYGPKLDGRIHRISSNLIIECKRCSLPWVFFSSPTHKLDNLTLYLSYRSAISESLHRRGLVAAEGGMFRDGPHHYGDSAIPRCVTYTEVAIPTRPSEDRDKKSNRQPIYDSIMSVLGFMSSKHNEWQEYGSFGTSVTDFYYPVVVLDGDLFEATVNGSDVALERRNHVLLIHNKSDGPIVFDVVTGDFFSQLLDVIEKDHRERIRRMMQFPIWDD